MGSPTGTAVALFTRDLRITDNPVLAAAAEAAEWVVPLFCLDPGALATSSPNRRWALATALADLRGGLRGLGGDLAVREGAPAEALARLVGDLASSQGVTQIHLAADASPFASARLERIRAAMAERDVEVVVHASHFLVEPGDVTTGSGGSYQVFTPYWRSWSQAPRRPIAPTPAHILLPDGVVPGAVPEPASFAAGPTSPDLAPVGESSAQARARQFLADDASDYEQAHDDLAADRTSRLSPHLHFGTVSGRWLEDQLDLDDPGHAALHRQLCWRDHAHQLLAANPSMVSRDLRPRGDQWRDDPDALEAWQTGTTGYPVVDAAMRQLLAEGWMHNRARMTVASFLTKHLRIDWREGAAHFRRWLVDHDVANNIVSWQWVAGTGTDSRPNRVLSPIRQAQRFDPAARYVRRWIPELREVAGDADAREPWRLDGTLDQPDYPARIVDHDEARERFLVERGR